MEIKTQPQPQAPQPNSEVKIVPVVKKEAQIASGLTTVQSEVQNQNTKPNATFDNQSSQVNQTTTTQEGTGSTVTRNSEGLPTITGLGTAGELERVIKAANEASDSDIAKAA